MFDPSQAIVRLLEQDRRYTFDAYVFLFEALRYAQDVLHMGVESASEPLPEAVGETADPPGAPASEHGRHVTGRELCEAIRRYAWEQYGYMAKTVLNSWGLHTTGDFGEIVFNLIRTGQMRKTPADARVDFDNLYDFDVAFRQSYKIAAPEE